MPQPTSIAIPTCGPLFFASPWKANMPVVDLLRKIAERKKATPAQIALAWLLAMKPWIALIPGTRMLQHLEEDIRAVDVRLTSDDFHIALSQRSRCKGLGFPKNI
jgi:aryl-alcohol dehydrogenase-like predicted oxidoreductase